MRELIGRFPSKFSGCRDSAILKLLDLARKSGTLPLPELKASLMNLAVDALSKFEALV